MPVLRHFSPGKAPQRLHTFIGLGCAFLVAFALAFPVAGFARVADYRRSEQSHSRAAACFQAVDP